MICSDGFSAGGIDLLFENNHVENGDDCLTVGNGARDIVFRYVYLGISVSLSANIPCIEILIVRKSH